MNHIDLWLRQGLPALQVAFPHVAGRRRLRRHLGDRRGREADAGSGRGRSRRRQPEPVVRPLRRLPRRARQLLSRLEDAGRADARRAGRVRRRAGRQPRAGAAGPRRRSTTRSSPRSRRCFMTAWQMLVDRAAIQQGETVLVIAGRLGRRHRGDPDREAVGRARHRDGVDRREAGRGARARAPTRPSTTRPATSWPRSRS